MSKTRLDIPIGLIVFKVTEPFSVPNDDKFPRKDSLSLVECTSAPCRSNEA